MPICLNRIILFGAKFVWTFYQTFARLNRRILMYVSIPLRFTEAYRNIFIWITFNKIMKQNLKRVKKTIWFQKESDTRMRESYHLFSWPVVKDAKKSSLLLKTWFHFLWRRAATYHFTYDKFFFVILSLWSLSFSYRPFMW